MDGRESHRKAHVSFSPDWPKHYSGQREIHAYLQHVAKKYNVYKQILFNTEVLSTEWLEQKQKWHVKWRSTLDEKADMISEGYFDSVYASLLLCFSRTGI